MNLSVELLLLSWFALDLKVFFGAKNERGKHLILLAAETDGGVQRHDSML
jgi:hypothetical protein